MQQAVASICFALKDSQGSWLSNAFWEELCLQIEKHRKHLVEQNRELVELAIRDNTKLRSLEKFFKAKEF